MICKSWQYPSHSPSSTLDSTPCPSFSFLPLSPLSRATSRLVPCIMHTLLSPIEKLLAGAISKKGDVCKFESDSTLSREVVDRLRNYCSDTRRAILADDDASMFHAESQALTYPFRDLNYLQVEPCIVSMPSVLSSDLIDQLLFADRGKNFLRNCPRDNVLSHYY